MEAFMGLPELTKHIQTHKQLQPAGRKCLAPSAICFSIGYETNQEILIWLILTIHNKENWELRCGPVDPDQFFYSAKS